MESAVLVEEVMNDLRENAHTEFRNVFVEDEKKTKDIDADIVAPRWVERQTHSQHFPENDNFVMQLRECHLAHKKLINSFVCLLPKLTTKPTADDEDSIK
ncbi:hypothetical protein PR048_013532 [Dryococelus australis]|uniref:Uncharacterized protein n=1 Tax=Dryococelus australis TaxID=614101 RepID=A0ABQ9HSV3_9NEOP|nr:hypothetical protein PR048_013532 [Dryococelus australis]